MQETTPRGHEVLERVPTPELRVGDLVREHGMRIRIYDGPATHPGNAAGETYVWYGFVENLDEVLAEGFVPRSFLSEDRWTSSGWTTDLTGRWNIQGNALALHYVERPNDPEQARPRLEKVWTVNVSGSERHDGEKPYTYVVEAPDMATAKLTAWTWHLWAQASEYGAVAADGTVPGRPDLDILAFSRNDDVVVIDCPEFPCEEGVPFRCYSPHHFHMGMPAHSCLCEWSWSWSDRSEPWNPVDRDKLAALGYKLPDVAPEETTW